MKKNNLNTVIVIQARRGSSRLPDKILLLLAGEPLLLRLTQRVASSKTPKTIVIATTTNKEDDIVAGLCEDYGLNCFRGSESDLLDRHYNAGLEYNADVLVKIPSDCPLICPDVIDRVLEYYADNYTAFDFVSNLHPATYPDGQDVEVIPMHTLKTAFTEAEKVFEREHTTPFIWERPERFRIGNVRWETGLDFSRSHRLTIDYQEDYDFIKKVYEELFDERKIFTLCDIMILLDKKPWLKKINEMYAGVNWYRNHRGELKTISF